MDVDPGASLTRWNTAESNTQTNTGLYGIARRIDKILLVQWLIMKTLPMEGQLRADLSGEPSP